MSRQQPALGGMFEQTLRDDFHTRVRPSDPAPSHVAAKKQTRTKRAAVRIRVLTIFETQGPMTDRQLVDRYRALYGPSVPESTIRTRRAELVTEQRLAKLHELTGPRPQTVWTFVK